jgi:hypothetical protein
MSNAMHVFPYPEPLSQLLDGLKYKDGWTFELREVGDGEGRHGLFLYIVVKGADSANGSKIEVLHRFPIPPTNYNEETWLRWLFEKVVMVERHEAGEFFQVNGKAHFFPHHRAGFDPYNI